MRFSQGIVKHGTEGVRAYREIAGMWQGSWVMMPPIEWPPMIALLMPRWFIRSRTQWA